MPSLSVAPAKNYSQLQEASILVPAGTGAIIPAGRLIVGIEYGATQELSIYSDLYSVWRECKNEIGSEYSEGNGFFFMFNTPLLSDGVKIRLYNSGGVDSTSSYLYLGYS